VIWFRGGIVSDDAVKVSVLDRTIEHGIGLFETFRTWNSHPAVLPRHRQRMLESAGALGLPIDPRHFPDAGAVAALLAATQESPGARPLTDRRFRVTLAGGSSAEPNRGAILWMISGPLHAPLRPSGAVIKRSIQVAVDDPLARHKTLNYWRNRLAYETALSEGCDEVLRVTPDGLVCEGTRSNIFLVFGRRLWTPRADAPLLPGIMRQVVLEQSARIGIDCVEAPLPITRLAAADEAFLTNSVRGLSPVARLIDRELPVPGPVTSQLWRSILPWLESGGLTQ
jgi:branched-subunit amino acid aminotransferase/4-amino-4-deoxychorismate lyase